MFTPSRLKVARQRLGLTHPKLAAASGVSLRSITGYESGRSVPTHRTLLKLAAALEVPPTFLRREEVDPVTAAAVSFRKLSKTSAVHRDAVLASASLAVEFFAVIEERFALPGPDVPTFDKLPPEDAADLVRRQWGLGDRPVPVLTHLLESKGVRLAALPHDYTDIDAFCFHRDGVPYVFVNTSRTGERQRFDAAHELGHLVLHSELEMDPSTSKEREDAANRFAAAFLMPAGGVLAQSMRGAGAERVLAARSYWRVSAMAMTHRLHELDLLSDWQHRALCQTLSDDGYRSSEPGGIVPETSQLLRKVMFGSDHKIGVRDAATALDLHPDDVRVFLRDLVPVTA